MSGSPRTVSTLGTPEAYYRDFPITFCNYHDKVHFLPNQKDLDFYQIVAQKLAQLYMNSLRSPVSSVVTNLPKIDNEKIEKFGNALKNYVLEKLLAQKMISLKTEKIPTGELQDLLQSCEIDLAPEVEKGVLFLPYKSEVFLNPYFLVDEYVHVEGLHIFMETSRSDIQRLL